MPMQIPLLKGIYSIIYKCSCYFYFFFFCYKKVSFLLNKAEFYFLQNITQSNIISRYLLLIKFYSSKGGAGFMPLTSSLANEAVMMILHILYKHYNKKQLYFL